MSKRPNILMIMADQFRSTTLQGMGDEIATPSLARLMERSTVFTQACCACPLCTPSRAALATGKYPHRCGVPVHDAFLPLDMPTYYQTLRKNGYRVGVAGKTDLHKVDRYCGPEGDLPSMYHYGFTDPFEVEGKMNCARLVNQENGTVKPMGPYQRYLLEKDLLEPLHLDYQRRFRSLPKYYASPSVLPAGDFQDNFIGRAACDWLEKVGDDVPWHYFVSFAGPHDPWDPPLENYRRFEEQTFPDAIPFRPDGKPKWVRERAEKTTAGMTAADVQNVRRNYAGAVSVIDDWVGCFLEILDRRGLSENTVVIFCADHGEQLLDHGLVDKLVMYEGALRIPLVIHMPGQTRRRNSDALVQLMDLAPTCLELAGLTYDREDMDARSLLPMLKGDTAPVHEVQISELIHCMAIYDGRYKWIRNWNDADELYDLTEDPQELHNLFTPDSPVIAGLKRYTFMH